MPLDHFNLVARFYDRVFQFLGPEQIMSLLQPQPSERVLDIGGAQAASPRLLATTIPS